MSTISNKATDYFIALGKEDEFGVVYSEDGKRLKGCNRKDIESYEIKEGTEIIGVMSFSDCETLKHLTIPNTVKTIERYAFSGCTSLQQLTIPSSIKIIDVNPFCDSGCRVLTINSPHFVFENEMLINKRNNNLIAYLGDKKTPVIPNWVNIIGDEAFINCDCIQQIAIPNSVVSLGYMAFGSCRSLLQILIPDSVTEIGYEAFCGCVLLEQIVIPESVTSIKLDTFKYCTFLRKIIVPYGSIPKFKQMLDKSVWNIIQYAPDYEEIYNNN